MKNRVLTWVDSSGLSGLLTIYSNGGPSLLSGHSWISFTRDGGGTATWGTWGNTDPTGLWINKELGWPAAEASRSMYLNDAQEANLTLLIAVYVASGEAGWQYLNPCSGFASDAWQAGTGESLSDRYFFISNPTTLRDSIINANGGKPTGIKKDDCNKNSSNSSH